MSKLVCSRTIKNDLNLESYGLVNPASKITIIKRDGSKVRYLLGDKAPIDENFYLLKEGETQIFLVDQSIAELMLRDESDFVKRELLPKIKADQIDLIEMISIYSKGRPDGSFTLANQGEYTFRLTNPIDNSVSTDRVIPDVVLPIISLYPTKLIDNNADFSEYGLDNPDYSLDLKFNKENYQVVISKGKDGKYYIATGSKSTVFEVAAEQIAFLQIDYRDLLGDSIYNSNVAKVESITITDNEDNRDYNLDLTGEATEIKAVIEGKTIEYVEFMSFYNLINSIGIVESVKETDNLKQITPYFTITLNKKNGAIDVIEFLKADDRKSYVRVNGIVNFITFDKVVVNISDEIKKIIE